MSNYVLLLIGLLCIILQADAKAVFAHFMVGNTEHYDIAAWKHDIALAQDAHIDAFALNIAHGEFTNTKSLANAFEAAENLGFKLFFSFDYAGNGAWPQSEVTKLLQQYSGSPAHYRHNGQPFVSTFEGPENAEDWLMIKSVTGCFFVPDWSSVGAKAALQLAGGVADGLFSWAAWPWAFNRMDTYVDASYLQYLGEAGKPYMMPAAPWFYTNMPGYDKNWVWSGENLWYDRWMEIAYLEPEWVQIISWNDYGESHYIGPLNNKAYIAFTTGKAPYNYVLDMPHDGWRLQLPYAIDLYKTGTASITKESLVVWYRIQSRHSCYDGGTTTNTASQLQIEFGAQVAFEDKIFFTALLSSNASVTVAVGGVETEASWESEPDGGIGLYHGSAEFNLHQLGDVTVTVSRSGTNVMRMKGKAISTICDNGFTNWNAWVGSATAGSDIAATSPKLPLSEQSCIRGSGLNNFAGLCEFSCKYGYCPVGACWCTAMGAPKTRPKPTGIKGYPKNGDANYVGLCSFACEFGYCPETACSTTEMPPYIPPSSPFAPPACVAGEGEGNLAGLCSFSCAYGYCPTNACWCAETGVLNEPPPPSYAEGIPDTLDVPEYELYKGLCKFACSRGYCPVGACKLAGDGFDEEEDYDDEDEDGEDGDDTGPKDVIIAETIWQEDNPSVSCASDCILVLPPFTLPSPTVVTFDHGEGGYATTLNVAWDVTTASTLPDGQVTTITTLTRILQPTVIPIPPITVRSFPLWPVTIINPPAHSVIEPQIRFPPQRMVITDDPNPLQETGVSHSKVTRTVTIPPFPWSSKSARDSRVPPVTVSSATDDTSGPQCTNLSRCGSGCHSPFFCIGPCLLGCGGGGFSASNDANPLPNPNPGPASNPNDKPDDDDEPQSCTQTATVTDVWVSCTSIDATSTSCSTTSSHIHTGCRATPSATTTIAESCPWIDMDDLDQGQDGGIENPLVTTTDNRYPTQTTPKTTATQTVPATSTGPARPVPTPASFIYYFLGRIVVHGQTIFDSVNGYGSPDGSIDFCTYRPDWYKTFVSTMRTSFEGVTVQGDTCDYTETYSWNKAVPGDEVGRMTCAKFGTARCLKSDVWIGEACGWRIYEEIWTRCIWSGSSHGSANSRIQIHNLWPLANSTGLHLHQLDVSQLNATQLESDQT